MLRTLKRFIPLRKTLLFDEVDVAFLNKLETDLRSRSLAETTISIVFRTLRAVFNKAREEERIPMTTYPFMKFKISKFNTQTKKRALKKEEVLMILSYDASKSKKLQLSKDIFIFSYLCQGINFIDIAYLKWSDVADNRVVYRRAKTGSDFSVGLKPASEEIINRYRTETYQRATDYIFPILDKHVHITEQQQTYRIQKLLAQVNKNLKLIGKEIGLNIPLTTYVARHSYATVLKMSGIPTAQISEALGHKSEAITQTYLKSFENSVIDLANEALL
jgi:integrase